jgi:hypothetical protein
MAAHAYTALKEICERGETAAHLESMLDFSPVGNTFEYEDWVGLHNVAQKFGDAGVQPACVALKERYEQLWMKLGCPANDEEWAKARWSPKENTNE